ncbi:MAG: photosynthetic reaction center subunit H [Halieaceae bacterium]|jgi:photosynthetic reaction center H subunit|nr:photosynthetic reaction center subunit H [Halieaceae bacterium]
MGTGAITEYIDVAQLVLYVFWLFFFTLVFWLHRETKREGYPLEQYGENKSTLIGFPNMPPPKTFVLPHDGGTRTLPRSEPEPKRALALDDAPAAGYPFEPNGDPMLDGVGPGSWAIRPEVPDLTHDGGPKIQPLRLLPEWHVNENDPDPRGKPVYGVDGEVGGTVVDIWVDQAEPQIRYFEVEVGSNEDGSARHTLLPINFSRVSGADGSIKVKSIASKHFANAPTLANPDIVTLQEEDKVVAYYGGGYLYAVPDRMEPLI